MGKNKDQPVMQVPEGIVPTQPTGSPGPSDVVAVPLAPEVAPSPEKAPRRLRSKGVPAAPVALAGFNTVAVSGAAAFSAFGPIGGVAVAGMATAGAAALVSKRRSSVKKANAKKAALKAGASHGSAAARSGKWSPGSGSSGKPGVANKAGSGSGRTGSVKGGSGGSPIGPRSAGSGLGSKSAGSGSGRPGSGSGSGRGPAGSGSDLKRSGSGKHGSKADLGGSGSRKGSAGSRKGSVGTGGSGKKGLFGLGSKSGKAGVGSAQGGGKGKHGSGSAAGQSGSGSVGKKDRPRLLKSSPTRTSLLRKAVGPKPGSVGQNGSTAPKRGKGVRGNKGPRRQSIPGQRGGVVRRGDGSRRQPIKATTNGAKAVGNAGRIVGHGVRRAHNSKVGTAARKWSIGGIKKSFGVGWPATAAAVRGVTSLAGGKGFRGAFQAMKDSWSKKRARWSKDSKHGKAAAAAAALAKPVVPASTVNYPDKLVGANAGRPAHTGGVNSMLQARFIEAAAEMLGAAQVYKPEGMMQVGNDFSAMPEAFRNIANAMQVMAQRAHDEDPIHPAILDQMETVYQHLLAASTAAEELAPAFENLHAVDIKRLREPRNGESRWDVSTNRDHVSRA